MNAIAQSQYGVPAAAGAGTAVLTYGTFDLFHVGHLNLLERLSRMGERLIVGVSTDEFNERKGKHTVIPYAERSRLVGAIRCVDRVIPETSWEQKRADIQRFHVTTFGIGADWTGRFDDLSDLCKVVYLPRTEGISTTALKSALRILGPTHVRDLKHALDVMSSIVSLLD